MAKSIARSEQLQPLPPAIIEAYDRLTLASSALGGFLCLLSGYNGSSELDAAQIGNLLAPVEDNLHAALDELRHVEGVSEVLIIEGAIK